MTYKTTITKKLGKRKCKACGDVFQKKKMLQMCCSVFCSIKYARELEAKKEKKAWKKRKKEGKEKIKTLPEWKHDLQVEINKIARLLDKDLPCISHPEITNFLRYDAGHAYTVKVHSDIRYNLHNIHKQCSEANERWGFCAEYAEGLKKRYGQEYLDMVLSLPLRYKGIGKDKYKIKNIREMYLPAARKIVRELKDGREYSRDEVNEMIGIYNTKVCDCQLNVGRCRCDN